MGKSKKYVKCTKCATLDISRPGHVGTKDSMRCIDCGGVSSTEYQGRPLGNFASSCRNCCPTGHGTRGAV